MSKNLIYQVKVGPNPPAFYDTCINSCIAYCDKHDIKHELQTKPILKIRPLKSQRSKEAVERLGYLPIYEKENAFNYIDDYDNIAIIDSDIFIRDGAPNIFDELNDDTAFAGVMEKDMPLTPLYKNKIKAYSQGQYGSLTDAPFERTPTFGTSFYNMGLMVFTKKIKEYLNGETPEQFIRRPEFERFVNGAGNWKWSTDQTLLNYWVCKSGMKQQKLDWKWNALFKGVEDRHLHRAHFVHFFLSANLPQKGAEIPSIVADLDKASSIRGHG